MMSGNYKQESLSEAEIAKRMKALKKLFGDKGQQTEGIYPLIEKDLKTETP